MKKLMLLEIGVLLVILIALIIGAIGFAKPAMAPAELDVPADTAGSTNADSQARQEQTQQTTTQPPEPTWMTFPEDRALKAQQYFVYDCDTDEFLTISGTQDERIYPASITKLFTAFVAMQYIEPETQITAGDVLDLVAWGSSVAELEKGDVMTAEKLVEAMLLPSGNDAAYLLAEQAGRAMTNQEVDAQTAVALFMEEMNEQAERLGMTGTHFVNPDGIHEDTHYTTFADLVQLGKLAIENESVMKYASVPKETVQLQAGSVLWENTNALIDPQNKYYCPYAVGLKTGQTPMAGSCLLSAIQKDGKTWLIGVFGCPEIEDRFEDTLQLFTQSLAGEYIQSITGSAAG